MNALLDSSFHIDLLNELSEGTPEPACDGLRRNPRMQLWVSAVTVAEVLEGADDVEYVRRFLSRFAWQRLHHAQAARVAVMYNVARRGGWVKTTPGRLRWFLKCAVGRWDMIPVPSRD